jgi:hypothetical protein
LLPNIEADPPNAGVPFVTGALGVDCANGLVPPAVKLKAFAAGGWGLKAVFWLLAPNAGAGKDADGLPKALLGAADCVGGKLFVEPPKGLLPPKGFAPLLAGAGVEAAKFRLFCCGAPKFALCDRPCARALARACSLRRSSRRPAGVNLFVDMLVLWFSVRVTASCCCCVLRCSGYSRKRRLLAVLILGTKSQHVRAKVHCDARGQIEQCSDIGEGEGGRTCAQPIVLPLPVEGHPLGRRALHTAVLACLGQRYCPACWTTWSRSLAELRCDGCDRMSDRVITP